MFLLYSFFINVEFLFYIKSVFKLSNYIRNKQTWVKVGTKNHYLKINRETKDKETGNRIFRLVEYKKWEVGWLIFKQVKGWAYYITWFEVDSKFRGKWIWKKIMAKFKTKIGWALAFLEDTSSDDYTPYKSFWWEKDNSLKWTRWPIYYLNIDDNEDRMYIKKIAKKEVFN